MILWNLRPDGRKYFSGRTMRSADDMVREGHESDVPPEDRVITG